jgi:hypothetical protein
MITPTPERSPRHSIKFRGLAKFELEELTSFSDHPVLGSLHWTLVANDISNFLQRRDKCYL